MNENIEETTENNEDTFFIADSGNSFNIAFDRLFEQPELKVYDAFELNSKRNFKNLAPMILETYNEIFLDEGGRFNEDLALVLFNMLNAKSQIMVSNETTSYESFIKLIDKITDDGNNLLLDTISKYVDSNYSLNLDEVTEETKEKKKKVNEELQFSDAHAKTLLKIAYLYRILIPIISVYFTYNKDTFNSSSKIEEGDNNNSNDEDDEEDNEEEAPEDMKFEEINSSIFAYLFEKFATNPKALRNKLYKLTYSRISKTAYSDKRFWTAAKNVAITKDTESLEIYKKLLTNAIPKLSLEKDKNVVSFLQSVINNQIDFLFQNKFKHKFTPLESTSTKYGDDDNDDDVSEFEKMEIQVTRKDEGSYLLRKLNIDDVVKSIPEKFNVGVTDAEVKALLATLNRNSIQEEIVAMLTFKYFNDKQALKFITFYQYCFLVIACKKYLEAHKYIYLPMILTANCEKHKERTNICGKKVRPEILSSKKYEDLFKAKYKNFSEDIEKPFLAFIGTTYSSVFKDKDGNEILDGDVKVSKIAEELLDLAYLV
jgi:hypothetical protein